MLKLPPCSNTSLLTFFLLSSFLFIAGCVPNHPEVDYLSLSSSAQYQSELSDPQAKALYAYGQFRLYAAEEKWDEAIAALERAVAFDPHSNYLKLLLAKSFLHEKMTVEATGLLDQLLIDQPDNAEALELRGDLANLTNDLESARHYYEQALSEGADNNDIRFRLAMVLAREKQYDDAITLLNNMLAKDPQLDVARLALARIYADSGQKAEADSQFITVLKNNPRSIQAALDYGKLLESEEPEKAVSFYQEFLVENPNARVIRQRLVEYYLGQQQFESALSQLQEIRWEQPDDSQVVSQIGLLQLELHNWTSAEKEFQSLLNRGINPERNRYYLALALAGQGNNAEAINNLKQISSQSVVYPLAVLQLAYLYADKNNISEAIDVLKGALTHGAADESLYYYLVALLGDNGRIDESVSYAQEGVAKYPKDERLLYQLGILYEKQNLRSEAVAVMEKVLFVDQNHADALNFLAYHQAESGTDLELALSRAKRALEIKQSGYIIDTLGWVFFKLGRYEEGLVQLTEAVRLHPDDPVITEHLGDLYAAMKLWEKAVAAYQKVLELDADAEGVVDKLRQVEKHQ